MSDSSIDHPEQPGAPATPVELRSAGSHDAEQIAMLHADSWRRNYRGAYADTFLDGDIGADRRSVWSSRLAAPAGTQTLLAEQDGALVGFCHVIFDRDPQWGSLVDNLHVRHGHGRRGIGSHLLRSAAHSVQAQASAPAMYLWVLQQNTNAQHFYRACGGSCVEESTVPPPGGDPTRLNGAPRCLRMAWPSLTALIAPPPTR
jgi:ribosomal protein S18 acetylase RimI-like enzyme